MAGAYHWVNEVGFLPLFANEIEGFSAEEHTYPNYWWTGDTEQDPWEWREIIARSKEVAYGKFFGGKGGCRILQIIAETVTILIPDMRTDLQISVKRSSWIFISVRTAMVKYSGSRTRFSQLI